jgi:plastocyanin
MQPIRRSIALALAVVALSVAACADGALGYDAPPASLDPDSPRLSASAIAFDTTELSVPANRPFTVVFENRETVTHNVSIYADDARHDRRFEGVLFSGPSTRWYPVPALAPGIYIFVCDLHPSMTGRLLAR